MFVSKSCSTILFSKLTILYMAAVVVQSIKAFASHTEGLVFYSRLDRHKSLKHVVTSLLLHGRRQVSVCLVLWYSIWTDDLCYSRCDTLKNPSYSMSMKAKYRSKFAVVHRSWWDLHITEKISNGIKKTPELITLMVFLIYLRGMKP